LRFNRQRMQAGHCEIAEREPASNRHTPLHLLDGEVVSERLAEKHRGDVEHRVQVQRKLQAQECAQISPMGIAYLCETVDRREKLGFRSKKHVHVDDGFGQHVRHCRTPNMFDCSRYTAERTPIRFWRN
jgi:hypothetical protein